MFGEMREKEKVSSDMDRVRELYKRYKSNGKKNSLMNASFNAFRCDIMIQFLGGITSALLNFMSPFIILRLVNFIEEGASIKEGDLTWESVKPGVILSGTLVGSQLLCLFIQQHILYEQVMTGVRSTNALIALIY